MGTMRPEDRNIRPQRPTVGVFGILIGILLAGILIGSLFFMPSIGSFFAQGGQPTGSHCNEQCDPNGSTCDPGLSCQREPDGGYVCWGGQDATGESCGAPARPTGGLCNSPCDPANPSCDPGLSCVAEPDGGFVCWGGTDGANQVCGQTGDGKTAGEGGACGSLCDPNASNCDAGLSCVQEPDGAFVCWDGKDSNQATCGQPKTSGGLCNSPCNPNSPSCDPGLSCVMEPDGGYVCWDGTDSFSQTCGQTRPTGGACNQQCDPANPSCDPGLSCVSEPDGGHVCWGGTDSHDEVCGQPASGGNQEPPATGCQCLGTDYVCTNADGTQTTSYNSGQCGGTNVCICLPDNSTYVCPDGTYAPFNPVCIGGGNTCNCLPVDAACKDPAQCKFVCQGTQTTCKP